ncbi:hypothetical protein [Methylomonas sp. DH-1]|uniref:hypothetical protein n=1 Tax=Methylomonas sp. (strain DH-1) TaxID=1727196 RepID=UPI000AAC8F99|nr:hypothetical protein [Methylomonas sp. DH-1]
MKCDIHINVVINEVKSISLQQPHALQTKQQVDLDQGKKLSLRAISPWLLALLLKLIEFISDKLGW